jgi:hypothetical protein
MTQERHEYSARRGQQSCDAETVDSVSSFFAASEGRDDSGARQCLNSRQNSTLQH